MKKKILETPDFIPDELWEEWVAYRKEDLKKPASLRSQKMQLKKIIELQEDNKLSAAERVKAKATERTNTFRLVGSDG